jgi:hypothetical protein
MMFCLANIGKSGWELTTSATNEIFSAGGDEDQSSPIIDYMQNLKQKVERNHSNTWMKSMQIFPWGNT